MAAEINPGLSAPQAAALWTEVLAGPCARGLSPEQRAWVELFRAVGGRDARMTRQWADVLLAAPSRSGGQFEYLALAAVSARVALGDMDSARSLMALAKLPPDRLDLPWFRYLGTIAAVKPRAP